MLWYTHNKTLMQFGDVRDKSTSHSLENPVLHKFKCFLQQFSIILRIQKKVCFLNVELPSNIMSFHTVLSWGNILWAKQYKKFGQIPSLVDLSNNSQNVILYVQKPNESYCDHLQRLELELAKRRGGKYDCCSATTNEELPQRNSRDNAAFSLVD